MVHPNSVVDRLYLWKERVISAGCPLGERPAARSAAGFGFRKALWAIVWCVPIVAWAQSVPTPKPDVEARAELARKILDASFRQNALARILGTVDQQVDAVMSEQLPDLFEETLEAMVDSDQITEADALRIQGLIPDLVARYRREELPNLIKTIRTALARIDFKKLTYQAGVPFYSEHFTVSELQQILAFQSSPVGQKLAERVPELMGHMMPTIMREVGNVAQTVVEEASDSDIFERYIQSLTKQ